MLSEQQQRIMGYFIEEAKDHLNTIEQGLVNLQGTINDSEMVNEVFRAAHSVKGGAAMLGLSSIQRTAHRLEDCFKVLKECPQVPVDQKLETLFLRVYDTLHELVDQLQGPFGLTEDKAQEAMATVEPVFTELGQHLDALVSQVGGTLPEDVNLSDGSLTPVPSSSPPVSSPPQTVQPAVSEESAFQFIFQNDVPARLREMLQLFKQGEHSETRTHLQAICRSLCQPGEQFDLPAWCELLSTAQRAIGNENNTYRVLAPIIIKDIKRAQELILSGRASSVSASDELLNLLPQDSPITATTEEIDFGDLLALELDDRPQTEASALEADDPFVALFGDAPSFSDEADDWLTHLSSGDISDSVPSEAANEATFIQTDTSELDFDLGFEEALSVANDMTTEAPDPSFLEQMSEEVQPEERAERTGPEVGVAELNSLADLFEGELPDLGLSWQQEQTLAANLPSETELVDEPNRDFSDLLPEQVNWDFADSEEEEDLSGLLNAVASQAAAAPLNSDHESSTPNSPLDSPSSLDSPLNSPLDSESIPPIEFSESEEIAMFFTEASEAPIAPEPSQSNAPEETSSDLDNLDVLFLRIEEDFAPESIEASNLEQEAAELQAIFATATNDTAPTTEDTAEADDFDALFDAIDLAETHDVSKTPQSSVLGETVDAQAASPVESDAPSSEDFSDPFMDNLFADLDQNEAHEWQAESTVSPPAESASELGLAAPIDAEFTPSDIQSHETAGETQAESAEPNDASDEWQTDFNFDDSSMVDLPAVNQPDFANVLFEETPLDHLSPFEQTSIEQPIILEEVDEIPLGEEFEDIEAFEEIGAANEAERDWALPIAADDAEAEPPYAPILSETEADLVDLDLDLFNENELNEDTVTSAVENADSLEESTEELTEELTDLDQFNLGSDENSIASLNELEVTNPFDLALEESAISETSNLEQGELAIESIEQNQDSALVDLNLEEFNLAEIEALRQQEEHQAQLQTEFSQPELVFDLELSAEFAAETEDPLEEDLIEIVPEHIEPAVVEAEMEQTAIEQAGTEQSIDIARPSDAELDDFADLEAILADEFALGDTFVETEPPLEISAQEISAQEISAQEISIQHEPPSSEEKEQSDALTANCSDEFSDEFADLEALLDQDSSSTAPAPIPLPSPRATNDDEFGDLEALLQDADQKLGGGSPARSAASATSRRPSRRNVIADQTMRVSVKHLDNLNNLVGEMVVNRNSLEQAQERLRQFLDNLLYQVQQLSDVGQRMRDLYERSLLESSLLSSRRSYQLSGSNTAQSNHATGASFDALEMDKFTGFHTLSQEMIELIVRVRESASDIDFVVEESDQTTRNFRQITTQLQEGLTRSRMVPFAQTADRLPRGVRDNAIKYGKQAELVIEGRDTLIDKMIVEQLYDPMTHLVNNAIAHGIETSEERISVGKSAVGRIIIRAFHQGNQTVISVSDDGAGINPEVVKRKAMAKGLISANEAEQLSRLEIYDLLFHHGFSTADQVDDLRGRGVGLDVVRNNLSEIRGVITIDSSIGKGTTFTIRLPLTLSISKALCCISHRARIAFPMDGVEDMLDVPKDRVQMDEQGRSCIQWRDALLPFQPLAELLKYNRVLGRGSVYGGNQEEDILSVVVLRSAGNYLALQVDQVLGEQEIVIKQLEGPVPKPIGVAGATVLGDGRIMPIADVLELIDLSQGRIRREANNALWETSGDSTVQDLTPLKTEPTVLIVDDSITVRELLSMTFNKVGYRVEQARDGQEAWEKLRSGLPCDLVFCDIEMPRMDGLELLSRLQKDPQLHEIPIAMLTSRGADRHRQMAVQLGAKGYFTKPYLEEVLLDAAQRMLKGEVLVATNA